MPLCQSSTIPVCNSLSMECLRRKSTSASTFSKSCRRHSSSSTLSECMRCMKLARKFVTSSCCSSSKQKRMLLLLVCLMLWLLPVCRSRRSRLHHSKNCVRKMRKPVEVKWKQRSWKRSCLQKSSVDEKIFVQLRSLTRIAKSG